MGTDEVCIICGKPAEFTERIFPAPLGVRRMSRKTYCGYHNEHFGKLVARLQSQLTMMHAALKVTSDQQSDSTSLMFTDGALQQKIPGDHMNGDMPLPFRITWREGADIDPLKAPIQGAAEPWAGANEWEKWSLNAGRSRSDNNKQPSVNCRIRVRGGGCNFLQSLGYLALTFFANSFAQEARQSGLDPFKAMLGLELRDDPKRMPENLVWWDGRGAAAVVGVNPVVGGHAVLVGVCETTSRAYAYISFFSCLVFGVDLGPVEHVSEIRYVTTFIDPSAETFVEPVVALRGSHVISQVSEQRQSMTETINPDGATRATPDFQQELLAYPASLVAEQILGQLPNKPWKSQFEGIAAFQGIIEGQGQIVFNLLRKVVRGFSLELGDFKGASSFVESLAEVDPRQPDGLTTIASKAFHLTILLIAMRMYQAYVQGTLDEQTITSLLYGASGQELILREVIRRMEVAENVLRNVRDKPTE